MKPKVWIIKEQMLRGHVGSQVMDYTPASDFGEIEFITRHDLPLYARSESVDSWNSDVMKFAEQYNETQDFIVPTGQPMAIFMVGFLLAQFNKTPRFLIWRNEENRYRPAIFSHVFVQEDIVR